MPGIPCLFCFEPTPPEDVKTTSQNHGAVYAQIVAFSSLSNTFDVPLGDACYHSPCCCLVGGLCAGSGVTACWARDKALKQTPGAPPGGYEYSCCQGYIPKMCCCDFPNWCVGSDAGLFLEGCCCPILSLSITRVFLMDKLMIRPDPGDFQLIRFSNCMQLLSCFCHILAFFQRDLRHLAHVIDVAADVVTFSVAGCMAVQINAELNVSFFTCILSHFELGFCVRVKISPSCW